MAPKIVRTEQLPSIDRLHHLFMLDDNWRLVRRFGTGGAVAGSLAGGLNTNGYRRVGIDYKRYYEHDVVFAMWYGRWPSSETIDHINGIKADNNPANLREATYQENNVNRGPRVNNKLGIKGVSKNRNRFQVRAGNKYIGLYPTVEDADLAYREAAKNAYGEFAWHK